MKQSHAPVSRQWIVYRNTFPPKVNLTLVAESGLTVSQKLKTDVTDWINCYTKSKTNVTDPKPTQIPEGRSSL